MSMAPQLVTGGKATGNRGVDPTVLLERGLGGGMTPGWIAVRSWWHLLASCHLPLSFP